MKEKIIRAFDTVLAANRNGERRNLLITDGNAEFLDNVECILHSWAIQKGMNLVELDERDFSWLPKIQTRELFFKLNQPNTVLVIKNYLTVNFHGVNENTPRNFLRDVVMNRHYGCGNDSVPSDELPNLSFVIALNDLSRMRWIKGEHACFTVIHEDDGKKLWTNTSYCRPDSKMHPVVSAVNKVNYFVSEDYSALCFDVGIAFGEQALKRRIAFYTADERAEIIHKYLENNLPDFSDKVDCLILKAEAYKEERFVLDGTKLKKILPNLRVIYCVESFEFSDISDDIYVLDPFEIGELCFFLAQEGDVDSANMCVHDLWAIDRKWARFFREVASDYYRKPEDHAEFEVDSAVYSPTGIDRLFHIYLMGWYHSGVGSFEERDRVIVTKHKNFDKALDLLSVRFKNCSVDEVASKLYLDLEHLKKDIKPDYLRFAQVLEESEKLCPGVLNKMRDNGWIAEEYGNFFPIRTCNMCGRTFDYFDHEENVSFDHFMGYGSSYDMRRIKLNLCCKCFDNILDWMLPQCKHDPMIDYN